MKKSLVAATAAFLACTGGERPPLPEAPNVVGHSDLQIGVLDGPDEYAFGMISGIAEGPSGQIFVSDAQQHVVRIYDERGGIVRSIGREGEGPGEFVRPCCITFGPEGRLWIRDGQNRRYQSIAVDAVSQGDPTTVRMNHHDGALYAPITFQPDGALIDIGHHTGPDGAFGLWRLSVTPDGSVADQVLVEEPSPEELGTTVREVAIAGGMSRYFFPQPFGPEFLVAHGPGGRWASAVSSEYVVTLRHGGETVEIRGPPGEGPPLSAAERQAADQRLDEYVERGGGRRPDYPAVPDHKTPLGGLFFDARGRLWVELNVPEDSERRADVYGDEGVLLERRVWPAPIRLDYPAWVGDDRALGIAVDSLGVQRVVRVRFQQASEAHDRS